MNVTSAPYSGSVRSPVLRLLTRLVALAAAYGVFYLMGWATESVIPRVVVAAVAFPLVLAILSGAYSWITPRRI